MVISHASGDQLEIYKKKLILKVLLTSTIAMDTLVPESIPPTCTLDVMLKGDGNVYKKVEGRIIILSLLSSSCMTSSCRHQIQTESAPLWLSLEFHSMLTNLEETLMFWRSLIIHWNTYYDKVIAECSLHACHQRRYLLIDSIIRVPGLPTWMDLSRQTCCSGTRKKWIVRMHVCEGSLFRDWNLVSYISSLVVSGPLSSERVIPLYIDTLAISNGKHTLVRSQSCEWYQLLRTTHAGNWTMFIRDVVPYQDTCSHCPNSSPFCCSTLAKAWNSQIRCNTKIEALFYGCCYWCSWIYDYFSKQLSILFRQCVGAGKPRSQRKRNVSGCLLHWVIITCLFCQSHTFACTDIRNEGLAKYPCLGYDDDNSIFNMNCSFSWNDPDECIILFAKETFEGNGHSVNLTGISNWDGLFQIADSSNEGGGPSSLKDAPVIHDVHMIGGSTSYGGGFIIQAEQNHFIVKHCSSSGVIHNWLSGGICGDKCSGDIFITNCWSSGIIRQYSQGGGGIVGGAIGSNNNEDNTVTISHCYSTGPIGSGGGGICGYDAGRNNQGKIIIRQCYSLGDVGWGRGGGDHRVRNTGTCVHY